MRRQVTLSDEEPSLGVVTGSVPGDVLGEHRHESF
jgi:hypothetical protein